MSLRLSASLDRGWRRLATGGCFLLFALCALTAGLGVAPLVRLCSPCRAVSQSRMRHVVRQTCRGFIAVLCRLGLIDYRFNHGERLQLPGRLVLANHPSLIDALFLLAYTPNASCVVKGGLARHPVTRSVIRAAGFIASHEPRAVIAAACEALENGQPLILFPEGTRSTPGQPVRLRRGGAAIAVRSGATITPVRIRCVPGTLAKGCPWYRIPSRRARFTFDVGEALSAGDSALTTRQATEVLSRRLEAYFNDSIEDKGTHDERSGT